MVEKAEILLVDDHALILEGICHILKRLPEVVVANAVTTGEEAVGLIAERDYDIYILDVGLPDVSGFELIDMIRELNEDARIIVNTMHEEIWYINRLVRQGVNSVILKASDSIEVENAVKSVLRGEAYTCPRFERIRKKLGHTSSQIHPKDVPTKREIEVLQAVAEGLCTHEIAGRLKITENTVETFRRRLIQKFNAKINTVTIGSGDKTVTIGGDSTYPFYSFDAPSENAPKIGVEISDMGLENIVSEGIKAYYDGASTIGEMAKKAAAMEGADFVALILEGGDPNGVNKSVDELIAVVKEVADAIDAPLVVEGCKNVEKDAELLPKVAEALQGRNVLILSEKEENYKAIGAAAGLAYDQIVGAESAVDINLAKQLNVVTTQLGVNAQKIVMNIGSAAAGYGYEYVVSTMDRIKGAALSQNDNMLQMPIITPVSAETWGVKEATASEKDMPEWGPEEERGIDMEVMTAAADLAAGSDAVILRHPEAVAAISRMIKALA